MRAQAKTTNIFEVVAQLQESMEDSGLSLDLVDVIVKRGLELWLGSYDASGELA